MPAHLALYVALVGCTGSSGPPTLPPPPATGGVDAAPPLPPPAGVSQPSVTQAQARLAAAGVETRLEDLVVARGFDPRGASRDGMAIRTGVLITDLQLTVTTSTKSALLDQLGPIQGGLVGLGGGRDFAMTMADIAQRVGSDAVSRPDLARELDELFAVFVPELADRGHARNGALIEAGAWIEVVNLVSKAAKEAGKPGAADEWLGQPEVARRYVDLVSTAGAGATPIARELSESLSSLQALADKNDPITDQDVDLAIQATDAVLELLSGQPPEPAPEAAPSADGSPCRSDRECPATHSCDTSRQCSPSGSREPGKIRIGEAPTPVRPDCGPRRGDGTCHPRCAADSDCTPPYRGCRSGTHFSGGDVGTRYQACF